VKNTAAIAFAFICAMTIASALASGGALAQTPTTAVEVLQIDVYEKSVVSNQSVTYNWTVQSLHSTRNLTVLVDTTINGDGWTAEAMSDTITLGPQGLGSVVVTVTAPPRGTGASSNLTVKLSVYDSGYLVQNTVEYAVTTINGHGMNNKVLGIFENPLPSPLDNEWGVFILDVVLWSGITLAVAFGAIPMLNALGSKSRVRIAKVVTKIIRTPIVIIVVLYGTLQSMGVIEEYLPEGLRSSLLKIYGVGLAIALLYIAYKLFREVVIHMAKEISAKTESHLDDILVPIVEKVGLVVIGLVGLGVLLGFLQVDLTLFVAGGVVTSMVIAFAAQDTLSNFFSGMFILTDRPFKENDVIILSDGDWAQVRKIGLRTTRLFRFSDASIITVPNNKLVNDKIANFSNEQDPGRLMKTFNVAYGSDVGKVRKIITDVINANPHIVHEGPLKPIIRFDAMSESSLDFFVLIWLDSRDSRFPVTDYLNTEIYNRFNDAGIEIPFPQRTVHVRIDEDQSDDKTAPLDIERIGGDTRRISGKKPKKRDG
jgi:MscS family membrane protein